MSGNEPAVKLDSMPFMARGQWTEDQTCRQPVSNSEIRPGLRCTKFYYRMLVGEELEKAREEGKNLSLFATCPNARRHRKKEAQTA